MSKPDPDFRAYLRRELKGTAYELPLELCILSAHIKILPRELDISTKKQWDSYLPRWMELDAYYGHKARGILHLDEFEPFDPED